MAAHSQHEKARSVTQSGGKEQQPVCAPRASSERPGTTEAVWWFRSYEVQGSGKLISQGSPPGRRSRRLKEHGGSLWDGGNVPRRVWVVATWTRPALKVHGAAR